MQQDLNERQQAVLDWVSQGCPDGVWTDSVFKTGAQALQSRGLIKITKRLGSWFAQPTEKGRQYLLHSGGHPAEQSNSDTSEDLSERPPRPRPRTSPKPRPNYTDQLLEELIANNGHLIKPLDSGPCSVNWTSRVNAARKSGKIPHTQELYGFRTHRGYEIKLVDIPAWRLAELTPLPVPTRLTLAEIAQQVGLRGEAAERKRHADQQAREKQQRRWEAAMHEARAAYAHAYRVKHLEEQADA
ncbi:hypothetical protein ACJ6WE_09460 [Streptomyces sp. MMS24-I31]|uniref:hypothetical protein n=1 Tax=Streptomyces sp. MMS24-I31 TaxID=3351563 RepID=UPI003896D83B